MTILITGGASGLGEAITRRIAKDASAKVYFTYNKSKEAAARMQSELKNTIAVKCDFRDAAEVNALCEKMEEFDPDVLINNAYSGAAIKTYFYKTPAADFAEAFEANIIPTMMITQAAIKVFRKKRAGKIITVLTSFLHTSPPLGSSVYLANKAYLKELSRSWSNENAKFNISSNSVSPAFMLTNFTSDTDERILEQMIEKHPHKKLLTPDEVADTIYLLMQSSSQLNGVDIVLNAGVNIQ